PKSQSKWKRRFKLLGLLTCVGGGGFLLGLNYAQLRKSFMASLGPEYDSEMDQYMYVFDPSDANFFLKKHFYKWLPEGLVSTPGVWKLVQECRMKGTVREMAICKLSSMDNLLNSECHHLSQSMNLKTAVALAHSGADPRLFQAPPQCTLPKDAFKKYYGSIFRKILADLPPSNIHHNLNYLVYTALAIYEPSLEEIDESFLDQFPLFGSEPDAIGMSPTIFEAAFLKTCLQALISHSREPKNVKRFRRAELLDLMLVIAGQYPDNNEIMSLVLKVLANLSCDSSYADDIRKSGCLHLLAVAARSKDVKIILPARRALHNLDRESSKHVLHSGIYQLYPDYRTDESKLEYDIVFVHGILGGAFRTWRQQDKEATLSDNPETQPSQSHFGYIHTRLTESGGFASRLIFKTQLEKLDESNYKSRTQQPDGTWKYSSEEIDLDADHIESEKTQCWPRDWLSKDCPNARIVAVDYDSFVTHWTGFCPVETTKRSIQERAEELLDKLKAAGIGERPIIWVTHSMGAAVSNKDYLKICQNTKGIVFCSVPHIGSYIALADLPRKYIFMPTVEAIELTNREHNLTLLHERFKRLWRAYKFGVLSFGELLETKSLFQVAFQMVPISTADPGMGDFYPVKLNHLNTCKPHCRVYFAPRDLAKPDLHSEDVIYS
ncbi:Protein SERAC1, partial [Orchesella cincta]